MSPYSRDKPSPAYVEIAAFYVEMHAQGKVVAADSEAARLGHDSAFSGQSLNKWLLHINSLIEVTHSSSILDYGSGKGRQYAMEVRDGSKVIAPNIKHLWNIEDITCFDPGVPEISQLPERQFDGVLATDVLEHIPESDVFWVVDELFSFADKFVFASIPCYKALSYLPDGRDSHITLRSPYWWLGVFQSAQSRHPHVQFSLVFLIPVKGEKDINSVEFRHSFKREQLDFSMLDEPRQI